MRIRRRIEELERRLAPNPLNCECRHWRSPTIADIMCILAGEEPLFSPRAKYRVCPRCGSRDDQFEASIAAMEQFVEDCDETCG